MYNIVNSDGDYFIEIDMSSGRAVTTDDPDKAARFDTKEQAAPWLGQDVLKGYALSFAPKPAA